MEITTENTPEENIAQEIWSILQKIKTNILHTTNKELFVKYKFKSTDPTEENEQEKVILAKLEERGAIKVMDAKETIGYLHRYTMDNPTTALTPEDLNPTKYMKYIGMTDTVFLQILPKFDNIYKEYKSINTALRNKKTIINADTENIKLSANKKTAHKITICLNQFGDLYKSPKNKYRYSMGEKADGHKILRYLIANRGYQQTNQIALQLAEKDEASVINTIGKFNSKARGKLKIKDNIILGKKGSGYRINPAYSLATKTE
jgi:hypothetical protein